MAEYTDAKDAFLASMMENSKTIADLSTVTGAEDESTTYALVRDAAGQNKKISLAALRNLTTVVEKNAYGIEFYDTGSNLSVSRVGNLDLHRANTSIGLPIQSKMKRVLMLDDGTVTDILHDQDSRYTSTGAVADLTGAKGQVMVRLPRYWYRSYQYGTTGGTPIYRLMMVDDAVVQAINAVSVGLGDNVMAANGYLVSEQLYVAAFLMSDKSGSRAIGSAAATSVASKRIAFLDANGYVVRESGNIEYPNQSLSDGSKRKYCSARSADAAATLRGASWYGHLYAAQKKLAWLFAVEYCTFNMQSAVNYTLTADGYRQGGLGEGFDSGLDFMGDGSGWSYNNAFSVPNGITVGLGNQSGEVDFYPAQEAQLMRKWVTNRITALPSLEVVTTAAGAAGTTTKACAAGGFVVVRNTPSGATSSVDYVLQNTSGASIAAGASVSITGGTGFTVHTASDSDYIYCIVIYGNIGVPTTSVPASGIILPAGGFIFAQNYNSDGTGKMFVITTSTTANGTSTVQDLINSGVLIPAIASDLTAVLAHQYVFDRATVGDTSTNRGYWICNTASAFSAANIANFTYVQDEYHYIHINSYRGVEFPFGYVWQWATDILFIANSDEKSADVWQCIDKSDLKAVIASNSVLTYTGWITATMTDAAKAAHLDGVKWKKIGTIPIGSGPIKSIGLGSTAEIVPTSIGTSYSTYFCDYFEGQSVKSNRNVTCLLLGAAADYGARCGAFAFHANNAVAPTNAPYGSRLCHD